MWIKIRHIQSNLNEYRGRNMNTWENTDSEHISVWRLLINEEVFKESIQTF